MHTLQDLGYAQRAWVRNPGFTLAALLSLAIGIGANTSIFSVANGLLLHPLPYPDADRLAILWNRSPGLNITRDWFSTAQYFDVKTGHHGFEQVAIAIGGNYNLTGDGEPERVGGIRVSSNLLTMLGARALSGRLFGAGDDVPGQTPAAVLSYGMWTRRYGSDPRMIGRSIRVNGLPYQVIGILRPSFALPREVLPTLGGAGQADILLPLPLGPAAAQARDREDYNIVGKLRRGVSLRQAEAEMATITARLRRDYPDLYPPNGGLTFGIVPLLEQVVGDVRRTLLILVGAVGLVLLVGCANVANLLLARAAARRPEIAVRTALGASRARILRQLLTESVALALAGGALGVLLAVWSVRWIRLLGAGSVPRLQDIAIDQRVLLFTLGLSLLSGILFGLAPALRVSRLDLYSVLKEAGRAGAGAGAVWSRGRSFRGLLVVGELALSVVLLIAAGLLVRSFARLESVPPGFNPRDVLTFDLAMSGRQYGDSQMVLQTYRRLWERLEQLSGATAAGGISALPLSEAFAWTPITIEGRTAPAGEKFLNADERIVGGRYFQAMEIPLRRGRFFNEQDTPDKPRVVIVDEHMAREFWPGQDAVGKRIHIVELKSGGPWQTVVGVVGQVKHEALDSDPRIAFYLPQSQFPVRAMTVVLRSVAAPAALSAAVKRELGALDRDLPMYDVRTMEARVAESLARRRFAKLLLAIFAALALALASIGVYGVMACLVDQGTREIGIRMALGASPRAVARMVLRQDMALALAGVVLGLGGAFALTRAMRALLFGIGATDAATYAAVAALLALVALAASYIPARRTARIDPMACLRSE